MTCLYCGGTEKLGTEHLIPRARGGLDIPENIFQACRRCNASKSDRLPSEWRDDLSPEIYEMERRALELHPKLPSRKKSMKIGKETVFNVRCTEEQKAMLTEVAAREGLGLSTWLLHVGIRVAQERAKEAQR